jgi:hypothetical protein
VPRRPVARKVTPPHQDTGALDASARGVTAAHDGNAARLDALRSLLLLHDEADQIAFREPSTDALREHRRTSRELAEAQRAFAMATGR